MYVSKSANIFLHGYVGQREKENAINVYTRASLW